MHPLAGSREWVPIPAPVVGRPVGERRTSPTRKMRRSGFRRHSTAGSPMRRRERAESEDQQGRKRKKDQCATAHDAYRQHHVACAAYSRQEKIECPNEDGAAEYEVRVCQGGGERFAACTHGGIEVRPKSQRQCCCQQSEAN